MKSIIIHTISGVILICAGACQPSRREESSSDIAKHANDSTFTERTDEKDADFIVNAVANCYGEIKMAQLAHNKSIDEGVKQMATRLADSHTRVLKELKGYADKNGIAVPLQEEESDSRAMNLLEEKPVNKFDRVWCSMMADRHERLINRFERRMNKTEDPELKTWISTTLTDFKSHLDMLDSLQAKQSEKK